MNLDLAHKIADAVLYEGYVLYPYRASAKKNQLRWQFGILAPPAYAEAEEDETSFSQSELLLEPGENCNLHVRARFLHAQRRSVERLDAATGDFMPVDELEVGGQLYVSWDEAVERQVDVSVALTDVIEEGIASSFAFPADSTTEALEEAGDVRGRIVRTMRDVTGRLEIEGTPIPGPYGVTKVRIRMTNTTKGGDRAAGRDQMLQRAVIAAHLLVGCEHGEFISLLDPPEWAKAAAESCENLHTFPVLAGADGANDVVLSSPIILYDHPSIAPESAGDMYDATEIDEILTLRTMALSDAEKREARATDARAAAVVDRADNLPPEILDRLHGSVRYLRGVAGEPDEPETFTELPDDAEVPAAPPEGVPWWNPGADASVSPETDHVVISGVRVARGSRVRLHPGLKRADAQDMFLKGKIARVEAVLFDVDGEKYLAVTLEDDPAADLNRVQGRFRYFSPDEVSPVDPVKT
jgi:hypothetical protein